MWKQRSAPLHQHATTNPALPPPPQLDGIAATDSGDGASVFGQGRVLLEVALEAEPGLLRAGDKYDRLLDALTVEAGVSWRAGADLQWRSGAGQGGPYGSSVRADAGCSREGDATVARAHNLLALGCG